MMHIDEFFKCKQPVRRIRQGQNETSAEFRTDRLLSTDDDNAEKRPGSYGKKISVYVAD